MKEILSLLLCLLLSQWGIGQMLSSEVLSNAGGFQVADQGHSLSWTMGEVFVPFIQDHDHQTGGFQQGKFSPSTPTENDEDEATWRHSPSSNETHTDLNFTIAPNPTTGPIYLYLSTSTDLPLSVTVNNALGKTILHSDISSSQNTTQYLGSLANMTPGIYAVRLFQNQQFIGNQLLVVE